MLPRNFLRAIEEWHNSKLFWIPLRAVNNANFTMKFQRGYYREPFRYIHKHNANNHNTFNTYNTRYLYNMLLQDKYLHRSLSIESQHFFAHAKIKSGQYSGFMYDGLVIDKVTLFRVSVLRHAVMSMNRERYVIRMRRERDRGLSLIRKTRQSTRKFLP